MRLGLYLATLATLALPHVAAGQPSGQNDRVRLGITGGIQPGDLAVHQAFTVQKNLEGAPITADTAVTRESWFDAGVVVLVKGRLGASVAVSHASRNTTASVAARVPHPFFFGQPRNVAGAAPASRAETATHIGATWQLPSRRIDVLVSAGPSLFTVTQTLVTDVLYSDAYPFDAATFNAAPTTGVSKTATGFHVGADVTIRLSAHLGIGGLLRFSRASATLTAGPGNSVTTDLGGLQAGAGVRVGF